jgi:hypothetical protein
MRDQLATQISEEMFAQCWGTDLPPYNAFLDAAAASLSVKAPPGICHLSSAVRLNGQNRIRLDGAMTTAEGDKAFFVELVWLPTSKSFRGKASVWTPPVGPVPDNEPLVQVFMPPLVTLLVDSERKKGSPLSEDEVFRIRDGGMCINLRMSLALKMAEQRGYHDIDPKNCWAEWCIARKELNL